MSLSLTISRRFALLSILSALIAVGAVSFSLMRARDAMFVQKRAEIRFLVESAASMIEGRRAVLAAGEDPDAIRKWLVARYGNWVSYDPPLDAATMLLWFGPLLFFILGGWLAFGRFRRGDVEEEAEG